MSQQVEEMSVVRFNNHRILAAKAVCVALVVLSIRVWFVLECSSFLFPY